MKGSQSVKNLHASNAGGTLSPMQRTTSLGFLSSIKKKEGPSFVIKSSDIPQVSRTIDFERLVSRPRHKPNRLKFDKTKTECLQEKENNPLTV